METETETETGMEMIKAEAESVDVETDKEISPFLLDASIFVALVDGGSMTHAGNLTGKSQSAVSRKAARWERDLGFPLVVRHCRGIAPTQKGIEIYRVCKKMLDDIEAIKKCDDIPTVSTVLNLIQSNKEGRVAISPATHPALLRPVSTLDLPKPHQNRFLNIVKANPEIYRYDSESESYQSCGPTFGGDLIGDVMKVGTDMHRIPNIGGKTVQAVYVALLALGLHLGTEILDWPPNGRNEA